MDAAQAIADLTEISSQIESVVVFDSDGTIVGSTFDDEAAATRFADAARALLDAGDAVRPGSEALTQLDAETEEGSVFVVRDGERTIAATAGADPTVGLVFYDLKSCLRALADDEGAATKSARRRTRKKTENGGNGA